MTRSPFPAGRSAALAAGVLGLAALALLAVLGGVPRVLVTAGSSMEPVLTAGDLVVLARGQGCEVGAVSAYAKGEAVFLHRVLAVEGGRCVMKGDANDWIDPDRPLPQEMLGSLVLRVPGAGGWWDALTSSKALGALAFVLVVSGGSGQALRRSRRTRRLAAAPPLRLPSRSWAPTVPAPAGAALDTPTTPPRVRSTAGAVAVVVLVVSAATALVPLAGSEPAVAGPAVTEPAVEAPPLAAPLMAGPRTVTFSYSAQVRKNDVYDTALAESPLPVFRALGQQVQVRAVYDGTPAELGLGLTMVSPTGWSRTLALTTPVPVADGDAVEALLDLPDLQAQAQRVAAQTQMPFEGLHLDLRAHVRSDAAPAWSPVLGLELSPTALRLSGEPATLVVEEEAAAAGPGSGPSAPTPASRLAAVLAWRPDPLLFGLVAALLVGAGAVLRARRQEESDLARAHRVLGSLVLPVEPVPLDGVRVVDVAGPDALVRLAERYGLLVLHWPAQDGGVFLVQDESTAYRYRAGGTTSPGPVEPVLEVAAPVAAETVVLETASPVPAAPFEDAEQDRLEELARQRARGEELARDRARAEELARERARAEELAREREIARAQRDAAARADEAARRAQEAALARRQARERAAQAQAAAAEAAEAERVVQRLQQEHADVAWSVQVQRLVPAQRQDLDALVWD